MSEFKPKISNVEQINGELSFLLSGDDDYGFDKSLVNALRRILLTDIPSIAFNTTESSENRDIVMVENNSSLHNEMLLHRISLIPLYIDPNKYMKNYLFECKVIHDTNIPFKFITMDDINIYPLKSGFLERLDYYYDDSHDMDHDDETNLLDELSVVNIDNYDLNKPLSQKEKDNIIRPFVFRDTKNYCIITELKTTNTEDIHQNIHWYGSPSIGYGYQDAKYQPVSQATYSFKINQALVDETLNEKLRIDQVSHEEKEEYSKKFKLAESERYYFRDKFSEANRYNFKIKSNHYYDSEILFIKSIETLKDKCESLKLEFIKLLKEEKCRILFNKNKEYIYHLEVINENHTLGNLIQTHISRRCINGESLINIFGYKKPHPLEDKILFIVSLNPKHKVSQLDEVGRFNNINTYLIERLDEIINDIRILSKVTEKIF